MPEQDTAAKYPTASIGTRLPSGAAALDRAVGASPVKVPEIPQEVGKYQSLTDHLHEEISILTESLGSVLTGPTSSGVGSDTPMPSRCSAVASNIACTNERLSTAIDRIRDLRINVSAAL